MKKRSQVADKDRPYAPCVCSCPHPLALFICESYSRMKKAVKAAAESMWRRTGKRREMEEKGENKGLESLAA